MVLEARELEVHGNVEFLSVQIELDHEESVVLLLGVGVESFLVLGGAYSSSKVVLIMFDFRMGLVKKLVGHEA